MTRHDFDTWTADLCRKFPAIAKWLEGLSDAAALLGEWADVLSSTPAAEALQANRRILAGDEGDLPGSFPSDWQTLPANVRRIAARLKPQARRDEPDRDYRPSDFPAGKMLLRMKELTDGGMPREDALKQVREEIPAGRPLREHRYDCYQCLDSRRIFVASPTAIRAMLAGMFDSCHHRIGVMRCRCDRTNPSERYRLETYSPDLDFKVEDYAWGPAEAERFRVWCEWQREHSVEQRAKACESYDESFAAWNNR